MAPAGTPGNILDRLNTEVVKLLADASVRARLDQLTSTLAPMTRAEFRHFIAKEIARYSEVVQRAGIKGDVVQTRMVRRLALSNCRTCEAEQLLGMLLGVGLTGVVR